ncbi:MAG: hypothetical protein EHM72_00480 [Calditrichaeota bacterium]|nr:MAG: hypothetical protein EHM72_00480 [Calditrichota bacterium]
MADMEFISQMRVKTQKSLLKKANVIGVGIGFKETEGKMTTDLSLKVLVVEKLPISALAAQDLVPKELNGVKTDVTYVGRIHALQSPTARHRPAFPGISIGHYAITAGTFGVVVRDRQTNERLILSNNHVLANGNNASPGDSIIQPGAADGGRTPRDRIADLSRFVKIQFKGDGGGNGGSSCPFARFTASFLNVIASLFRSKSRMTVVQADGLNLVDAAVAKPISEDIITEEILKIGQVSGSAEAKIGMKVRKSGRTTGYTEGEITVLDTTIEVGYGGQVAMFEHQILASGMSEPGDSGSLIVDQQNHAVGLLFAGSANVTVLNPIAAVLTALNITL